MNLKGPPMPRAVQKKANEKLGKLNKKSNKLGLSWAKLSSNWNFNLGLLKLRFVAIDFKKNTTVNMGCLQTRTVTE